MGSIGEVELLMLLVLLAAFVWFLVLMSRRSVGRNDTSAEKVLDQRYAAGEIWREEYLDIRDDIKREQNA